MFLLNPFATDDNPDPFSDAVLKQEMSFALIKVFTLSRHRHLSTSIGDSSSELSSLINIDESGITPEMYFSTLRQIFPSIELLPLPSREMEKENEVYVRLAGEIAKLITDFPTESTEAASAQRMEILKRHSLMKMAQQEAMFTYSALINLLYVEQMGLTYIHDGIKAPVHWKIHAVTIVELIADLVHLSFPHEEIEFFDNSSDIGKSYLADSSKYLMRITASVESLVNQGALEVMTPELQTIFGYHKIFKTISHEVRRIPITDAEVPKASAKMYPGARVFLKAVVATIKSKREFDPYSHLKIMENDLTEFMVVQGKLSHGSWVSPEGYPCPVPLAEIWWTIAQSFASNINVKYHNTQGWEAMALQ